MTDIKGKAVTPRTTQEQIQRHSPAPARLPRNPPTAGHRWPKKLLTPIARLLKTGNPTDTVDRLFDSQHVNDLRLIAATAFVLALLAFTIALIAAVSFCLDAWKPAQGATLPHLIVFLLQYGGVHFLAIFAPVLAIFGGILAWAYQVGSARLGVVDLFACEIDTLSRVTTVVAMVDLLVEHYSYNPAQTPSATDNTPASAAPFSSQENYFPILDNNSEGLQTLEANVVSNITAYYTYMKAVRDTFRRMAESASPQRRHETLKSLIYMLYLALESGRKATDDLVEFEPTHTERTLTTLLTELDAYTFLRGQYNTEGEVRHDRLILRGPQYTALVQRLNDLLLYQRQVLLRSAPSQAQHPPTYEDTQWSAALQSLPALNARFEALRNQHKLDCPPTDGHIAAVPSPCAESKPPIPATAASNAA